MIPDIVSLPVLCVFRKTTLFCISHFAGDFVVITGEFIAETGNVVGLRSRYGGVVKLSPKRGRSG